MNDLGRPERGAPDADPGNVDQAGLAGLVLQDQARMLYTHGCGGIAMTAIASLLLVFMVETPGNLHGLIVWLCAMAAVLAMRGVDLLVWHPRRWRKFSSGRLEIGRYSVGVGASAALWVAFPLLFFSSMSQIDRACAGVVFAAMAGGSPIMLGAILGLASGYCLCLILPFSLMFLLQPDRTSRILGMLGLCDAVIMMATCKVFHDRVKAFIRLVRSHQMLMAEAVLQQGRTQAAQVALHDANQFLEQRIEVRTADLQREIMERKGYARALALLASTDPLTGMLNRVTLSERLSQMLAESAQARTGLAVLFLDLDGFKQVNDVQGHWIGDHVLRVVASRLAQWSLEGSLVARWGGDEFVIVTRHEPDEAGARLMANAIRASLTEPIDTEMLTVRIGVTIGIALYPVHGTSQDELIRAADVAMYAGKKEGGGRVTTSDPRLTRLARERRLLEQSLREAPGDGGLAVHYQPIINTVSGRCDIMEALLRWTHPELGEISPDAFISILEWSEQIIDIGRFVLIEACQAAMLWPGPDPPAVAVNVSIAQILSGDLPRDVQAALEASGLPAQRLHLEITEKMFGTNYARILPVLEALRGRGLRLALDDFGSGFSSWVQLRALPIHTIKIDKMFVQEESEEGGSILRAMLLIARAMHLETIAEGVETERQRSVLTTLGTTCLQGYLFSRPMPAAMVSDWLAAHAAQSVKGIASEPRGQSDPTSPR